MPRVATLPLFVLFAVPVSAQVWEACPPRQTLVGEAPGDQFGWVGDRVGDVDADGVADFALTAPFHDTAGANAGRAYVYSGASGALLYTLDGPAAGANLGHAVSGVGDLNGDGHDEVVLGAPALGTAATGSVLVFSGIDGSLFATLNGEAPGDQFGYAVAGPGDVDADGTPDLFVGADAHDGAGMNAGRAYVISGASMTQVHVFDGVAANALFGRAVNGIGDRDFDGYVDLVVGSPGAAGGVGQAYVFDGQTGSLLQTLDTDATGSNFGQFFAGFLGDVNADGTPDFFVSDWNNSALGASTGRVFVYSGVDFSVLHTLTGTAAQQGYGIGRGWAGDVDGDGHDDMVFGSWLGVGGGMNAGDVQVRSGADGSILARWTGSLNGANLGFDAAGLGDVDGDGEPDFLGTAASANGARGVSYVFSGADPRPPKNFCSGAPHSAGPGARMTYRRSLSVQDNVLRLRVEGAPPGVTGLFFYGSTSIDVPFGDGRRCVGGGTARLGPVDTVSAAGNNQRPLDFTQGPLAAGATAVTGGSTWHFQFWFRDPASGGAGFNLSDGLTITFCD